MIQIMLQLIESQKQETQILMNEIKQNKVPPTKNRMFELPDSCAPSFSGNFEDWMPFWDLYRPTIHENSAYTLAEKFLLLRASVFREAKTLVNIYPCTDAYYQLTIDALKERFYKPEKIRDIHFKQIKNLKIVHSMSHSSLLEFHDNLKSNVIALKHISEDKETTKVVLNYLIRSDIQAKLPAKVQLKLSEFSPNVFKDIEVFLCALEKFIDILDNITFRHKISQNSQNNQRSYVPKNRQSNYENQRVYKPHSQTSENLSLHLSHVNLLALSQLASS